MSRRLHATNGRASIAFRMARNTSGATEYGACAARLGLTLGCTGSASSWRHACDLGPPPPEWAAAITGISADRIRQLAAHEVGHTLGFNHNFAASTYGGRASVMDYPAPRILLRDGRP